MTSIWDYVSSEEERDDEEESLEVKDVPERVLSALLQQIRNNEISSLDQNSWKRISTGSKARGLNALSDQVLPRLCDALRSNSSLTTLQLRHTGLETEVITGVFIPSFGRARVSSFSCHRFSFFSSSSLLNSLSLALSAPTHNFLITAFRRFPRSCRV